MQPHHDVPGVGEPDRRDVPGMLRLLRWLSHLIPMAAGPLPIPSSSGCSPARSRSTTRRKPFCAKGNRCPGAGAGDGDPCCRGPSHLFRARIPTDGCPSCLPAQGSLSLYVPIIIMRVLCQAIWYRRATSSGNSTFREKCAGTVLRRSGVSPIAARRVRRRADALSRNRLMNPFAKLMWRICKIDGPPSRFRVSLSAGTSVRPSWVCLCPM